MRSLPTMTPSKRSRTPRTSGAGWIRDPRMARFARLFDRREFFRAHEVLEELWLEVEGADRAFLQGLIQLAVALEHDARGNPRGARKVLRSAGARLSAFGVRYAGVAHGHLREAVTAWLDRRTDAPPRMDRVMKGSSMVKKPGAAAKPGGRRSATATSRPRAGGDGERARSEWQQGRSAPRARAGKAATGMKSKPVVRKRTAPVKDAARVKPTRGAPGRSTAEAGPNALEPIDARRARAVAIADGLEGLYPEAKCEMQHASALELLVATILSAQCTDVRVNMTTPALFAKYRSAADYARADFDELCTIIKSTGFFNNKAKSIIALGQALEQRHGGRVPGTMEELVSLPGVGRKTANVLLSEWFGVPGIAVDTHVIRLTGPIWRLTDETDPVKIEFALYDLLPEARRSGFGIATIFHGRRICIARRPNCGACALVPLCPSAQVG